MNLLREIQVLLKKEFVLEWRQKNALYSLVLYVASTVFICYLSFYLKTQQIGAITWNALFWIILLFISINAIAKSFMAEKKERNFYYYYIASPEAIILSKIIYNASLMLFLSLIAYLAFTTIFPIGIQDRTIFLINLLLGAVGFSNTLTLISGIVSKANNNGTLMAILSIPVMIPILLVLIKISIHAIDGISRSLIYDKLMILGAINLILVTLSFILFPYLWKS
ncbi:MAG: ABC transporter permease [Cytophagales bacterium]|nr:ABC transporter permease [Cytophagales bacterium]